MFHVTIRTAFKLEQLNCNFEEHRIEVDVNYILGKVK
jgi:hypothetical protein